jgi:diguanylate cyclase (GGDEF)-like protein
VFNALRRPAPKVVTSRGRHAEALSAAIEALGAGGDARATLRALARASRAALDADRAMIWVVDSAVGLARVASVAGEPAGLASGDADYMRLDDTIARAFFSTGALQIAHDQSGDPSQPIARRFQARSLLGVPFVRGNAVAGMALATSDRAHRDWSADDVTTLSALALQTGLALERASMAADNQRVGLEDPLTGLPNRSLFIDRLSQALAAAEHKAVPLAVCVVNLDGFKDINDALGHAAGDTVLCEVAARLRSTLRAHETVARLGADEFAILLPANQIASELVAERLLHALSAPVTVAGQEIGIAASIGVATYPDHGDSPETLLRRADVALLSARRAQTGFAIATPGDDTPSSERFLLIGGLRQALAGIPEGGFLELHYQPKVNCQTGLPLGAEALVRWHHPTLGLVSPARFIPLAEQTGLIRGLSRWALETAIKQCQEWLANGWQLSVAVNLSAYDVQDAALPELIGTLLERYAVPAERLTVEMTESMLVQDPDQAMAVLARLHDLGVRASLDDFGTGYSSLAYLKRLPIDELKIDQSFVRDLVQDSRDQAIVASTIGLGHSLGMVIVAEGVEDEPTLDLLRAMGSDTVQGYFLCRPQTAAAFAEWIATRTVAPAGERDDPPA